MTLRLSRSTRGPARASLTQLDTVRVIAGPTVLDRVRDVLLNSPRMFITAGLSPLIFVDGRPSRGWDLPRPNEIAAIEAHRGLMAVKEPELWLPSWLPYSTGRRIVLIWTVYYVE